METKAYVIIFGSLFGIIGLIAGGFWLHSGFGTFLIAIGATLAVAWIVFLFQLSMAMGSDI